MGIALALAAPFHATADLTGATTAPSYTAAGVVNAATQLSQSLAPNAIASLYGTNLSFETHAVTAADLTGGMLPTSLSGVEVLVNGVLANLFYVSAGQINFLVPYSTTAASASIVVVRDATAGPTVSVPLAPTAPAFFEWSGSLALAVHTNGDLITADSPAVAGEFIILFAEGMGRTQPDILSGEIALRATPIMALSQLRILLNGMPVPAGNVYYAGLAPGFSGLYQINLLLPAWLPPNPSIQIAIGPEISPDGVELPASGALQ